MSNPGQEYFESLLESVDPETFVLEVDPDWTDHFHSIDQAFTHYTTYMEPSEIRDALGRIA